MNSEPEFEFFTDELDSDTFYIVCGWEFPNKTTFITFIYDLIEAIIPENKRTITYSMIEKYGELHSLQILGQYNKCNGIKL
jgi:hypothetical protein